MQTPSSLKNITINQLYKLLPTECIEALKGKEQTVWFLHVYYESAYTYLRYYREFGGFFESYELALESLKNIKCLDYNIVPFDIKTLDNIKYLYICTDPFYFSQDWEKFKQVINKEKFKQVINTKDKDKKYYQFLINNSTIE